MSTALRTKVSAVCSRPVYRRPAVHSRRPLGCRATMNTGPQMPDTVGAVKQQLDRFFKRYDVLSSGMGALIVTSYCVYRGQDAATALSITLASTVVALVLNELMTTDSKDF